MTNQERLLILQRLPGVGAATYWRLLDKFVDISSIFSSSFDQLATVLPVPACEVIDSYRKLGEQSPIMEQVRADLIWLKDHNVQLLDINSEFYPQILKGISRPPPALYVWGNPAVLSLPQIAVIGSRNPTSGGKENAYRFSQELASAGIAITSGLALGVDAVAHKGAVKVQGSTIAVLGTGIDQIYPRRHHQLAEEIVSTGGAVISEFPLGTLPLPGNFPQRNRIISGLSCGVLVVEAAIKSGSLITARYALQQNREVFAIPGSIHNPLSRGAHALIKDGAKLVETSQDIIDELAGYLSMKWGELDATSKANVAIPRETLEASELEEAVLEQLGFDPVSFEVLSARTQINPGELTATLLIMELKGLVVNVRGEYSRQNTSACFDFNG